MRASVSPRPFFACSVVGLLAGSNVLMACSDDGTSDGLRDGGTRTTRVEAGATQGTSTQGTSGESNATSTSAITTGFTSSMATETAGDAGVSAPTLDAASTDFERDGSTDSASDASLDSDGAADNGDDLDGGGDNDTQPLDAGPLDAGDEGNTPSALDAGSSEGSDAADASLTNFPPEAAITNAWVPTGFAAWQWASGLQEPRGVTVDDQGTILVVEQDAQRVSALWDEDGDGVSGAGERAVIATAPGLNHGIALNGGFLYASSAGVVYRWAYDAGHVDLGTPTEVVTGIPSGGNHTSRTLLFDDAYLYVSVGSASNVDPDSSRAQVRRFSVAGLASPRAFDQGELFADGLRNEVGLAVDGFGQIWGVENGMDNLNDSDFGGDIHEDNPGEELNLFATPGRFYGYPYCWSEYSIPDDAGAGPGAQWWLEGSERTEAGDVDDAWCKDPNNVVPPALVFPAHVAPLDIRFYTGENFPSEYKGDALVTFHGSWNTQPPAGYKVVRVHVNESGQPQGGWEPLYEFAGSGDTGAGWSERPVGLVTLPDGTLLITSDDDADRIVAVRYFGANDERASEN